MSYRAEEKLKNGVKIKLDLTKSRFALLNKANGHVKEVPTIIFCYVFVNSCLKLNFSDESQKDLSLSLFEDLCDILDRDVLFVYKKFLSLSEFLLKNFSVWSISF